MPLTVEDTPELFFRNRTSGFLDPKKLRNAAALVYAHCMSADLNPHIIYQSEPDEDGEKGWFMCISWTLPHSLAPDVPRKRKFTGVWFWLNWLN